MANIPESDSMGEVDKPKDRIEDLFIYHTSLMEEEKAYYTEIRQKGVELTKVIDEVCPAGPDRTAAVRKVREAVMTANAAIATGGGFYE